MYQDLGEISLKSGEKVRAGIVVAPAPEWEGRLVDLLSHKGDPWTWQTAHVLRQDVGIEVRFYLAHREGRPISNVMTVELAGVGILGHVFTRPEERRKGAMSHLLAAQMEDFRARGGRALFLGTGFDSHPYRMYERFGFRGIEPRSGYMAYYAPTREAFEAEYFAPGEAELLPVDWPHWPASAALFVGDFPGRVRCAPLRLFGRASTEGPLLPLLRGNIERRQKGQPPAGLALQANQSTAVVGLAAWGWDPLWPDTCLLDVWCHPAWWDRAAELLGALELPEADRCIAYGDSACEAKLEVLRAAGFRQIGVLPRWLAADRARSGFVDVVAFERG